MDQEHPLVAAQKPREASIRQLALLGEVQHANKPMFRAFLLKEELRLLYPLEDPALAPAHLDAWLAWASAIATGAVRQARAHDPPPPRRHPRRDPTRPLTGLRNLPFGDFEHNRVWLMLVLIAHDLLAWTQRLALTGELARCEPKRLRYRVLHVAARLAFHARTAILRIDAGWPWRDALIDAFARARALPAPA